MVTLPTQYKWLSKEPGPKMLLEALNLYGTEEIVGSKHNPVILNWAKELGITDYTNDEIPWCGLFIAIIAKRAGKQVVQGPLWAQNWAKFGIKKDNNSAELGDVLVFIRQGGGHVGLYVGEDENAFHVLGGNQSNSVNITRVAKNRLFSVNSPIYTNKPENVRKIILSSTGQLSKNEQ